MNNQRELNQDPKFLAASIRTNAATEYAQDEEGRKWTTNPKEAYHFYQPTTAERVAIAKAGGSDGLAKIISTYQSALPKLPIKLKFAPEGVAELQQILASKTAWNLWMLWKSKHITNQNFNDEVLHIASRIDATKPQNDGELRACFGAGISHSNFNANDTFNFCREALPYFTGEAEVTTEHVPDNVQ